MAFGKPGVVIANPGRPRSLERRVRELVDFDAITLALQDIAMGRLPPGISSENTPKIRDRIEAAKVLMDRGHGKAKVTIDLAHDVSTKGLAGIDVDALDDQAFAILEQAVARAIAGGQAIPAGSGGTGRPVGVIDVPEPAPALVVDADATEEP